MAKSVQLKGIEAIKNIVSKQIPVALANAAKRGLLGVGYELIEKSVNMAPLDTGELVESAKLKLGGRIYAKGVRLGEDETGVEAVENAIGRLGGGEGTQRLRQMTMSVSYRRYDEFGEDIAIMLHEDLLPRGRGPKKARKPGRSGKFLEAPMNEVLTNNRVVSAIRDAVIEETKKLNIISKK